MASTKAIEATEGRLHRSPLIVALLVLSLASVGSRCVAPPPDDDPSPGSDPIPTAIAPLIGASLNGITAPHNDLLVVPPSGFVMNVAWLETDAPVDPASLSVILERWGGTLTLLSSKFTTDGQGTAWMTVAKRNALPSGSYTLYATISDTNGLSGSAEFSFAVRDFTNGRKPIGTGQAIWYDFNADRDSTPGPDFDVDLEAFGLRSGAATAEQNDFVRGWVISEALERVRVAYYDSRPSGLPDPDPIDVDFSSTDPGTNETTRICVGGEDPSGGAVIGNIALDYGNANRASQECATLPPTGVFPREFLSHYTGQTAFKQAFDPLRPGVGGTPIGADPLDGVVLSPDFDPLAPGTPITYLSRFITVRRAVESLGNSLGTILAHETGHALGLVPGGPPGGGLFGGGSGPDYAHNVEPDGTRPNATWLMNGGGQFSYAELAGAEGEPLAEFRPLNHAYLRDRVVIAPSVTELLPPPGIVSVAPSLVTASFQTVTIQGAGFAPTPSLTLSNAQFTYHAIGEQFLSETTMTAGIVRGQVVPGVYDLTVANPDGQSVFLPQAITIE